MSRENLTAFATFVQLPENSSIEEELHAIPTREAFVRRSVQLGRQYGYEFTVEEIEKWIDELEAAEGEISFPIAEISRTREVSRDMVARWFF
jgi:hypothetical protein